MANSFNFEKFKSKLQEVVSDISANVSEGARALGEMSADLLEKTKSKAEELYEFGSDKFEQAAGVVHDYTERYRGNQEIKQLYEKKTELSAMFGDSVFHEFKKNGSVSKRFLTTKKIDGLTKAISQVDKEILRIGKELDKIKK